MIMAGIQAEELLASDCVSQVILMHANGVAFRTDAKKFALDGVEIVMWIQFHGENFVERFGQSLAWPAAVGGGVFHAVRDPNVSDGRGAERRAHGNADFTTKLAMLDPKLANLGIRMRQGETAGRFRMGKTGGIKIKADPPGFRPGDPVFEMPRHYCVTVDLLAVELPIEGV